MDLCSTCKHEAKCASFDDYAFLIKGDPFEGTSESCEKYEWRRPNEDKGA